LSCYGEDVRQAGLRETSQAGLKPRGVISGDKPLLNTASPSYVTFGAAPPFPAFSASLLAVVNTVNGIGFAPQEYQKKA
jgi:hypothetical protein